MYLIIKILLVENNYYINIDIEQNFFKIERFYFTKDKDNKKLSIKKIVL